MRLGQLTAIFLLLAAGGASGQTRPIASATDLVESRFGFNVRDPYRWMENRDDPALSSWLSEERAYTTAMTAGGLYDSVHAEFAAIYAEDERELLEPVHDEIRRRERQWQRRQVAPGTPSIWGQGVSPSGKLSIVTESESGSDLEILRVRDVASGHFLADVLAVKFASVFWDADERAFIYTSDRDGRLGGTTFLVRRHRLGTPQNADEVLYEGARATDWVSLYQIEGQYYLQRNDGASELFERFDATDGGRTLVAALPGANYEVRDWAEGRLWLTSYAHAAMGEVITLDFATGTTQTVLGAKAWALEDFVLADGVLYLVYVDHAASRIIRHDLATGQETDVSLADAGWVRVYPNGNGGIEAALSRYDRNTSFWQFNAQTAKFDLAVPDAPTTMPLVAERIEYEALKGVKATIWVLRAQDTVLGPETPVYLYGYGGFRINIMPYHSRSYEPWLKRGGAVAFVTLPGGLELGEDWHKAGMLHNKRNVFDAFAAAGRTLIQRGWTSPHRLAIGGGSNGGLLVAATMNLYPRLFGAAVPEVGVLDFLRYPLFTGGKWWLDEYGNPDNRADFVNLYSLSPYHNLRPGQPYPATLVVTADHDDRVVPTHSYKYAARLQAVADPETPALLYVRRGASHGGGGPAAGRLEAAATKWTFLLEQVGGQANGR